MGRSSITVLLPHVYKAGSLHLTGSYLFTSELFVVVLFCGRWMGKARCGAWTQNTDPIWSKPWGNSTSLQLTPSARPLPPRPGKHTRLLRYKFRRTLLYIVLHFSQQSVLPSLCLSVSPSVCLTVPSHPHDTSSSRPALLKVSRKSAYRMLCIICILITAVVWKPKDMCTHAAQFILILSLSPSL